MPYCQHRHGKTAVFAGAFGNSHAPLLRRHGRLEGRGTESREDVEKRLGQAVNEIKLIGEYDYYIVNDVLEESVQTIKSIMLAEASRVPEAVKPIIKEYESQQ